MYGMYATNGLVLPFPCFYIALLLIYEVNLSVSDYLPEGGIRLQHYGRHQEV